jgi:hypothetical protein
MQKMLAQIAICLFQASIFLFSLSFSACLAQQQIAIYTLLFDESAAQFKDLVT